MPSIELYLMITPQVTVGCTHTYLYIESIFSAEIRLQLKIINGTKFKQNFQKISRGIVGNLWHINSEFPRG